MITSGPALMPAQLAAAAVKEVNMHNVFNVPLRGSDGKAAREFRVSPLERYQVTDWATFDGGSCRTIAADLTLAQANEIAITNGLAHPGSLVNTMEPPYRGSYVQVTEPADMAVAMVLKDGQLPAIMGLQTLPYELVAMIRVAARRSNARDLLDMLDQAQVAVDVKAEAPAVRLSLDAALAIRSNLQAFNMSTAEIDAALAEVALADARGRTACEAVQGHITGASIVVGSLTLHSNVMPLADRADAKS